MTINSSSFNSNGQSNGTLVISQGTRLDLPRPEICTGRAKDFAKSIKGRQKNFVEEWRPNRSDDPGVVLRQIFAEMTNELADRVRGLPEKALVEHLRIAGISPLLATPASAMVVFQVADAAPDPVLVPQHFPLGAAPANGGDIVVFETDRSLLALPGKIAELGTVIESTMRDISQLNDDPFTSFLPFGPQPRETNALFLALDTATPGPKLSLGIGITSPVDAPPSASAGALYKTPTALPLTLAWEAFDGNKWVSLDLIRDETFQFSQSGIIDLQLPDRFPPGRPDEAGKGADRCWLRVRIVSGRFTKIPRLDFLRLNAVWASAGQTVREEVLNPLSSSLNNRFSLAYKPIIAGSLQLEVDDGQGFEPWTEVSDLSPCSAHAQVFVLDPQTGEVTFGNGINGRRVPYGFRNVRAKAYRWGGGIAGAVKAEAISSLLGAVQFLTAVTNPRDASGGDDGETLTQSARHGPQAIRTHGRAVLPADFELLALRAPGARVGRVHAMPTRHPSLPDSIIPGVVGLLVVPAVSPEELNSQITPPLPDEASLQKVAQYVADELALAGMEIVAGAPIYHWVRVEAAVKLAGGVDQSAAILNLIDSIKNYFHPLQWPFGAALRYSALMRLLLEAPDVLAVLGLTIMVNGHRLPAFQDYAIGEHDLFWSTGSLIIPVED